MAIPQQPIRQECSVFRVSRTKSTKTTFKSQSKPTQTAPITHEISDFAPIQWTPAPEDGIRLVSAPQRQAPVN